jgi:O-succinylbenzoic acid--CoA ligase
VIDSEEPLSLEELLTWSQDRLVNFQRPMALLAMPAELKSSGIKVSRRQLQQWVAQQIASR